MISAEEALKRTNEKFVSAQLARFEECIEDACEEGNYSCDDYIDMANFKSPKFVEVLAILSENGYKYTIKDDFNNYACITIRWGDEDDEEEDDDDKIPF